MGEGVWLVNPAATAVTVYAAGEVPLDDALGVPLVPGLNLIAYPYLSAPAAESLTLDPAALTDAAGAPVAVLIPGDAYWYRHDGPTSQLWLATRPYANPFTTHAQAPQIVRLDVIEDGQAVRLTLHAPSATPLAMSVFYQDLQPATPFDPLDGWQLAARGLMPSLDGDTHWEDRGGMHRPPPQEVFGRVYVVAAPRPGEDEAELWISGAHGRDWVHEPAHAVESNAPFSGSRGLDMAPTPPFASGVLYVNAAHGDDQFDGRARMRNGGQGPKRTIGAALRVAQAAPRGSIVQIEAAGGRYPERVEIPRGILLTGAGRVDLTP